MNDVSPCLQNNLAANADLVQCLLNPSPASAGRDFHHRREARQWNEEQQGKMHTGGKCSWSQNIVRAEIIIPHVAFVCVLNGTIGCPITKYEASEDGASPRLIAMAASM